MRRTSDVAAPPSAARAQTRAERKKAIPSDLLDLGASDGGVGLGDAGALKALVVKRAAVVGGVSMLGAKQLLAAAREACHPQHKYE